MQVAKTAAADESLMLLKNEEGKSECLKKALNHRSEKSLVGIDSVFSGVKATRTMMISGDRIKPITRQ